MQRENRLITGARALNITFSDEQAAQFVQYENLLIERNQQMNLIAAGDVGMIRQRHFVDSLTCSLVTGDLNGQMLIDVGSGAGFPGLPLKILFPGLKLTLVESSRKKARFLQEVVDQLKLSEVLVITDRAETVGHNEEHREMYDWAVARAVARLGILIEYLLPFVRAGGHVLMQKGRQTETEMSEAENGVALLGGGPAQLIPVQVPEREEASNLVLIEKIKPVPDLYPRRIGVPAKRPL